jgi:hypothetical protein
MSVRKLPNGRWEARERTAGRGSRRLARTFDRKADADKWVETMRRQRQLGAPLEQPDLTLDEFVVTYWELHAIPNLAKGTRDSYRNAYERHISPRIGDREVRALTPKVLTRFRTDLERANVGVATVRKALAVVQSILSFAIVEEHLELNAAAAVAKPFYERAREPYVFLPLEVEQIRGRLDAKGAALVALLAYAGPRPRRRCVSLAGSRARGDRVRRAQDAQERTRRPAVHAAARSARRRPQALEAGIRRTRPQGAGDSGARRRGVGVRRLA